MIYPIGAVLQDRVGQLGCDTSADVPNLEEYASTNNLGNGTTCLCADTSEVYFRKSDGTWVAL